MSSRLSSEKFSFTSSIITRDTPIPKCDSLTHREHEQDDLKPKKSWRRQANADSDPSERNVSCCQNQFVYTFFLSIVNWIPFFVLTTQIWLKSQFRSQRRQEISNELSHLSLSLPLRIMAVLYIVQKRETYQRERKVPGSRKWAYGRKLDARSLPRSDYWISHHWRCCTVLSDRPAFIRLYVRGEVCDVLSRTLPIF